MLRSILLAAGGASLRARRALSPSAGSAVLSVRQQQVLAGVARGLQTKEIARELGIAEGTVKTHISRACERLGARTRAQAVARYAAKRKR
jgi:DNA-binding NarL/FixJ family response regulator